MGISRSICLTQQLWTLGKYKGCKHEQQPNSCSPWRASFVCQEPSSGLDDQVWPGSKKLQAHTRVQSTYQCSTTGLSIHEFLKGAPSQAGQHLGFTLRTQPGLRVVLSQAHHKHHAAGSAPAQHQVTSTALLPPGTQNSCDLLGAVSWLVARLCHPHCAVQTTNTKIRLLFHTQIGSKERVLLTLVQTFLQDENKREASVLAQKYPPKLHLLPFKICCPGLQCCA